MVRVRLSNLVLKALLNQQAGALEDLELFDPDLHRNLTWMLVNDITGVRLLASNLVHWQLPLMFARIAGWRSQPPNVVPLAQFVHIGAVLGVRFVPVW